MTKAEAREFFKEKRNILSLQQIDKLSLQIANQSLQLKEIWSKQTYHIFLSIERQKEVDTSYLLHILQGKDKNITVSKTDFVKFSMTQILITDQTQLKLNKWGIPEPVEGIKIEANQLDVVFVPLLGVDLNGQRVGYGKGFYDRFLALCKPDVLKVGLGFFAPIENNFEDCESTDIALDFLITPNEVHSFP